LVIGIIPVSLNLIKDFIPEDFMRFIDQCLSDYFYKKKLDYSLTSVLEFREDWLEPETIKKIKEILKEKYNDQR
jgi:hypothetical protein